MASNDELEIRVSALERDVRVIRQDAAAVRVLAGGADRDVSAMTSTISAMNTKIDRHEGKLDVHKALLDALRETQIEQGEKLVSLEQEMRQGFGMLAVGQAEIVALLSRPDDAPPSA